MLYNLLAKLGLYLVARFYVYKGPTFTVTAGRNVFNPRNTKSLREIRALNAWAKAHAEAEYRDDLKYIQQGLISPYNQRHN